MSSPLLNIAVQAARLAGKLIIRAMDRLDSIKIHEKGRNDFVSQIDKASEAIIIQTIQKAYPNHGILAEESGLQQEDAATRWIIDPLDGTTNFLHGFPHFAISIAVQHNAQLEAALVYDPIKEELFTATRGGGTQLNNRRLRVSTCQDLSHALLGTGFPFKMANKEHYFKTFTHLLPAVRDVRRAGAAALDLAYVAAGRLDGFWEFGLSPWDIAAGALLITEAGGRITEPTGESDFLTTGNVIAGNLKVCAALQEALAKTE